MDEAMRAQAAALLAEFRAAGATLATAESCTGGLVCAALTAVAGSSDVVLAGFVTYANAAKVAMVGVPESVLAAEGAVSEPVARRMAEGALARSGATVAVSCTGVAGPGGGSAEKPVGLVHLAAAGPHGVLHRRCVFGGDRDAVREATVMEAFALARAALGSI